MYLDWGGGKEGRKRRRERGREGITGIMRTAITLNRSEQVHDKREGGREGRKEEGYLKMLCESLTEAKRELSRCVLK
jgi:hypothetical protein